MLHSASKLHVCVPLGQELKLPLYGRFWASSALQCERSASNWFRLATGNPSVLSVKTITSTCVRGRRVGGCLVTQHITGLTIRGPCKLFDVWPHFNEPTSNNAKYCSCSLRVWRTLFVLILVLLMLLVLSEDPRDNKQHHAVSWPQDHVCIFAQKATMNEAT